MFGGSKWLVLGMGALALTGANAAPTVEVVPLPETLLPDGKRAIGQPFDAMPGDLLLSGRIVRTEAAIAEGTAKVAVDRFTDTIGVGDELTSVLVSSGMAATLGTDRMYCGRDQRSRSSFASMMIGELGSKFKEIVRFCFLDLDRDGKFDQYLLAGAKDKLLQAPKPLDPLAYRVDRLTAMHPNDEVRVRYRKYVPSKNKVEL